MAQTIEAIYYQGPAAVRDYTPGSAVDAGEIIKGDDERAYVAVTDIAASVKGAVHSAGVFKVKKGAIAFADGEPVYWDVSGNTALDADSTIESGDFLIGTVPIGADALSGDDYVLVDLNTHPQAVTGASS